MVYVINKDNEPLMPTTRHCKVRILLKNKLAKVVKSNPFTIQLLYETKNYTQPITLGVDSGYAHIGFSAKTEKEELICGELNLLEGQKKRLHDKSMYRRIRRNRLRYRKPRFNNRIKSKKKGWLAPSIQHKLDSHKKLIEKIRKILPITKIIVEVANFDVQKIKNPDIKGKMYQQGEMMDFWNLREYVLHRDNHQCQNPDCKNKSANPILEVHHIIFRSKEGCTDSPSNVITLCSQCHAPENHNKGKFLYNWYINGKKTKSFRESTFMSIVRWYLVEYLKSLNINTEYTYGYKTKNTRITYGIQKTHYNDAFCIAGGTTEKRIKPIMMTQARRNNRSLEKFYDAKYIDIRLPQTIKEKNRVVSASNLFSGRTTRNKNHNTENLHKYRGKKISKGRRAIRKQHYFYQPNDIVIYQDRKYIIKGTHCKGKNVLLKTNNSKKPKSVKISDIKPYKFQRGMIIC